MTTAETLASLSPADRESVLAGLTPEQLQALQYDWPFWARPTQLPPAGDWTVWLYLAGRGAGKLLSHDTPLPTPAGWTTMGAVAVGEELIDEAGRPCRVLAKYSPRPTHVYRLVFDDGAEIVADGDHQWVTWTHRDRKQYCRYTRVSDYPVGWPAWRGQLHDRHGNITGEYGPRVRTTAEIVATLRHGSRGDLNHSIPASAPLALATVDLPCDPWALGYWLGNGSLGDGVVTAGSYHGDMDGPWVAGQYLQRGYEIHAREIASKGQTYIGIHGLLAHLRAAGVITDKHIPRQYLRGSIAQRLSLLRGLMDSDGYAGGGRERVEYCSTSLALANGVYELVTSLGEIATQSTGHAMLRGVDYGPKYRVTWRPTLHNPFGLPRKARQVKEIGAQALRTRGRMIVDAIPIKDPPPMSCVTVDSPHSMYLCGRQMIPTHNTRSGAEWVRSLIAAGYDRIGLIAPTAAAARDVLVEGESGILAISPQASRPLYEPSKCRLTWPSGQTAYTYSAEEPDRLRGPQHSALWCDEVAAWDDPQSRQPTSQKRALDPQSTWDMAMMGLRLGQRPRALVTTTPRPIPIIRSLMQRSDVVVTREGTRANAANLAPAYLDAIITRYEGTRLGRQELDGEVLDDTPGALWTREILDAHRIRVAPPDDALSRIVIGVDPSGTSGADGDESDAVGICVAALGTDGRGYVLADLTLSASPAEWGARVVQAWRAWGADRIVVERNFGGDMCRAVIAAADQRAPIKMVTATRGKVVRAEPIAALYEQGRVSHCGLFAPLEDELCQFTPTGYVGGRSPNRADALVWALTELMLGYHAAAIPIIKPVIGTASYHTFGHV